MSRCVKKNVNGRGLKTQIHGRERTKMPNKCLCMLVVSLASAVAHKYIPANHVFGSGKRGAEWVRVIWGEGVGKKGYISLFSFSQLYNNNCFCAFFLISPVLSLQQTEVRQVGSECRHWLGEFLVKKTTTTTISSLFECMRGQRKLWMRKPRKKRLESIQTCSFFGFSKCHACLPVSSFQPPPMRTWVLPSGTRTFSQLAFAIITHMFPGRQCKAKIGWDIPVFD